MKVVLASPPDVPQAATVTPFPGHSIGSDPSQHTIDECTDDDSVTMDQPEVEVHGFTWKLQDVQGHVNSG